MFANCNFSKIDVEIEKCNWMDANNSVQYLYQPDFRAKQTVSWHKFINLSFVGWGFTPILTLLVDLTGFPGPVTNLSVNVRLLIPPVLKYKWPCFRLFSRRNNAWPENRTSDHRQFRCSTYRTNRPGCMKAIESDIKC